MTQKTLDTLVSDIYALFEPTSNHEVSEENLDELCETLKETLRSRLSGQKEPDTPLRFSALGQPDRKVWMKAKKIEGEALSPKTYFKFLYGDVIETLLVFLIREAGHTVENLQDEVEVEGVKGHIDAIVDGVVVDIKSASPFGFTKFKNNSVVEDDPFGYTQQLSGYANVLTPDKPAAWIAMDKVSGELCVSYLSSSIIADYKPAPRINHLKEVIEQENPPPLCYDPIPDGKSGNKKLGTGCSYCEFKHTCFPGLRTFIYSTGPRYLTDVVRVPDVLEIS